MDYDQLKKDMEAGTQGDAWVIGDRGASIYIKGNGKPYKYAELVGGAVHDYDFGTDLEFSDADLDRICRVPQLERIALAAEAMSKALGQLDKWFDTDDKIMIAMSHEERLDHVYQHHTIRETLAAYREATK